MIRTIAHLRAAQIIATVLVAAALFSAFRTGIGRDLHSTFAAQSWGRVQFAIGAAVTSRYHGGYGYTISDVVRGVLTYAGLTGDPATLKSLGLTFPDNLRIPSLMENAIKKAISFTWPFNPNEQVTGSQGEDVGLVDYVRLSFALFGPKMVSFFLTYFILVATSFMAALVAFRKMPAILAVFVLYAAALAVVFRSNLLDLDLVGILDPRFLSTLGLVPAAHIAFAMLVQPRASASQIALALVQSAILVFAYWIRSSALWTVIALALLAALLGAYAMWRSDPRQLTRNWPFAVVIVFVAGHFIYVAQALHPVYQTPNERPHHALWHAIGYALQIHPKWPTKYAAKYGASNPDEIPQNMAKDYLLHHPPDDPDRVYVTTDREHLRIGVAEFYKRKAVIDFAIKDPEFVAEVFLIYNPQLCLKSLAQYLSSYNRAVGYMLVVLAVLLGVIVAVSDAGRAGQTLKAALIVTGGLLVSLIPIALTAPSIAVMADQFVMLLVSAMAWLVAAVTYAIRAVMLYAPAGAVWRHAEANR